MIEIEKKFLLNDDDISRLTQGAEFLGEKTFTDSYFDTEDYSLTRHDKWLRNRDGRFELKLPMHEGAGQGARVDQYDELEDEDSIRAHLSLPSGDMANVLAEQGYTAFATVTTTRRKYQKGGFGIDLDIVDLKGSPYHIGEIEVMVNDKSEMDAAADEITQFATQHGLRILPVRGKVVEYIKRHRPDHYQALVAAGAIQDQSEQ